jgi:hypothetical protein
MTEHHPQLAPVYIMVQPGGSKDDKEHYAKTFPRKSMLILSSLQVIASGLAALTQVCSITVQWQESKKIHCFHEWGRKKSRSRRGIFWSPH